MSSLDAISEHLDPLDVHFADLLQRMSEADTPDSVFLAGALASRAIAAGDVCLDLDSLARLRRELSAALPSAESWTADLSCSELVGAPGQFRPLILEGRRLYLHRYWRYESQLAKALHERAVGLEEDLHLDALIPMFRRLFPASAEGRTDWQAVAAAVALFRPLTVISGGPGTGKTTTVARILALLLAQWGPALRIALTAPTGKAAARLEQAIATAREELKLDPESADAIPSSASTVHRLLGSGRHGESFRHDDSRPLPLDVLVLDEASMIDLAMMSRLLEALPRECRLLVLGDHHQLASVEAGAVLSGICEGASGYSSDLADQLELLTPLEPSAMDQAASPLSDSIVVLQNSYRFDGESSMGQMAGLIRSGDAQAALDLMTSGKGSVEWRPLADYGELDDRLEAFFLRRLEAYSEQFDAASPLEALGNTVLLTPFRRGPWGAAALNSRIHAMLVRHGIVPARSEWYPGRPVMISQNDYEAGLYNGDIGVCVSSESGQGYEAVVDNGSVLRRIPVSRLPPHEEVFAMTVHKSQGSEFSEVVLLVGDQDSAILTRELIYTAVTRARDQVVVWGEEGVFKNAVQRRVSRASGLADRLWPGVSVTD